MKRLTKIKVKFERALSSATAASLTRYLSRRRGNSPQGREAGPGASRLLMTTVKKRISSHPVTLSIEKHVWKEVKERGQGRVTHNDDHLLRGEKDAHKIQYGLVRGISSVYPHDEDYCHFHSFQKWWGEGGRPCMSGTHCQ